MGRLTLAALALSIAGHVYVPRAAACGGFFCGRQPVDQTAERIVFRVHDDSVTMVVQIAYGGAAADFAWVLPLGTLPDVNSLAVFPQRALTALDANTGPVFQMPAGCYAFDPVFAAAPGNCAACESDAAGGGSVNVHYRAEVGPYDVAAISSDDPMALYQWLRDNAFNVNAPMLPYIEAYTNEGLKFLALKLKRDAETSDIQPFRFEFPGTVPSVPLRMTALAAEPEMGILVTIFGDQRYAGANWPAIEIADDQIVWAFPEVQGPGGLFRGWQPQTNWAALVARGVDEAGGQGWVTEFAGSTEPITELLANSNFATPEDEAAGKALIDLIGEAPYVTRLYTRLSAEEMSSDPIFRRDPGGDVAREHKLPRTQDGKDVCSTDAMPGANGRPMISVDPCSFASCGAGGICRPVQLEGMDAPVAGCGCLPGATARTTVDPAPLRSTLADDGTQLASATVVCQDARMSFVNPGDTAEDGAVMDDPCKQFDCGPNGECLATNMTPTCVCDRGFVAVGSFAAGGARGTRCERPVQPVPDAFYAQRLPDLPVELPGGRVMEVDEDLPVIEPSMDDLHSMGMPLPRDDEPAMNTAGSAAPPGAGNAGPNPTEPDPGPAASRDDGCSVRAPGRPGAKLALVLLAVLGLGLGLGRRRGR